MRALRLECREKSGRRAREERSAGRPRESLARELHPGYGSSNDRGDVRNFRFPDTERRESMEEKESRHRCDRRKQEKGGPAQGVHQETRGRSRQRAPQREDAREEGVLSGRELLLRQAQEEHAEGA